MKKILLSLLLLSGIVIFCGCEKEPQNPENPNQPENPDNPSTPTDNPVAVENYPQAILGSWNVLKDKSYESYTEREDYTEITYVQEWAESLSFTFHDNGTLTYLSHMLADYEDSWDDTYSITNDILTWDTKEYRILSFTEHSFVMEHKVVSDRTTAGGETYQTVLIKHYEMER